MQFSHLRRPDLWRCTSTCAGATARKPVHHSTSAETPPGGVLCDAMAEVEDVRPSGAHRRCAAGRSSSTARPRRAGSVRAAQNSTLGSRLPAARAVAARRLRKPRFMVQSRPTSGARRHVCFQPQAAAQVKTMCGTRGPPVRLSCATMARVGQAGLLERAVGQHAAPAVEHHHRCAPGIDLGVRVGRHRLGVDLQHAVHPGPGRRYIRLLTSGSRPLPFGAFGDHVAGPGSRGCRSRSAARSRSDLADQVTASNT